VEDAVLEEEEEESVVVETETIGVIGEIVGEAE
jgi:hypothetical protein